MEEITKKIEPNRKKIIGNSYIQLMEIVKRFAENDSNILFVGERGTGKELFAQYYMDNSPRKGVRRTVNCAAVSDNLIDSEVFGHIKGAFTNAAKDRKGLLTTCNKGILCLDEFGDASPRFQASILRIAQGDSYRHVGSDDEITNYDTVVIAGTNKPDNVRVELKDRFHILYIPPLQSVDIPRMAEHFCGGVLREGLVKELMESKYPGNIRQLKQKCERLKITYKDNLFVKQRKYDLYDNSILNYERYEKELLLWKRYIQPLLNKYELHSYNYIYEFAPAEGYYGGVGPRRVFFPDSDIVGEIFTGRVLNGSLVNVIEACYQLGTLSWLLNQIELRSLAQSPKTSPPVKIENTITLPDLLKKHKKEAVEEFEKIYFRYHIENSLSNEEAAKNTGMNLSAFNTAKSRLKKLTEMETPS